MAGIRGLGKHIKKDSTLASLPRTLDTISSLLAQNNIPLSGDSGGSPSATIAEAALLALEDILTHLTETLFIASKNAILSPVLAHWPHIWKWLRFLLHRFIGQYDMDVDLVVEGSRYTPHDIGGLDSLEYRLTNVLHMVGRISTYQLPNDTDACASTPGYLHTVALVWMVNAHRVFSNYPTVIPDDFSDVESLSLLPVSHKHRFYLLANLPQHPISIMHTNSPRLYEKRVEMFTELLSFPDTNTLCQQLLNCLYVRMTRTIKARAESFQDLITIYAVVIHLLCAIHGEPGRKMELLCMPIVLRITSRLLM